MRWACIHDKQHSIPGAPPPCGGVAFYCLQKPFLRMTLDSDLFLMPDGNKPADGSEVRCGSCGEIIDMIFADEVLTVVEEV